LFFHCAFLTKDRLQDQSIDAFIAGNKAISHVVAGAIESCDARGLFMPSSGAVYKKGSHILDDDMQANPYGVMKHHDEERFVTLAKSKNMPVCIPRLFNLAGPFINKIELYALASMIASCQRGQGMTIRAPHRVIRSYIHVADLVALGFDMLLNPKRDDVPVFDTAGEVALELSELADAIRNGLGKPETVIHRPDVAPDKDDRYVGDGTQFMRMMNAHGLTMRDINVQIRDTADYLASQAS
ncbi:MAG: NAD-dependent epimerase/dehydratase family protein, partial [Alphaproteobacteria bacterium]|nr:NAD-dependent epimerase/dehydratase family protein [Alphaproteobacteria bacterium]